MRYLLDTNILIYAIKHKPRQVYAKLMARKPEDVCISVITFAELIHGCEKSKSPEHNKAVLMQMLANIEVLDFDATAAYEYGKIKADLETKGTTIGSMDALIAGHARSLNCVLVTNNTREFARVKDLQIENWAE